ncbi:CinA family protein [Gluconobacter cerinus]|uniref:CinA family protein n=1 Tax=Gluconobacter cerinus TaxID=38307 RepID=UPI00193FC12B|nr:nicotinamide-nucleotide amidohydrolase family protein [Gluconobacter cerinus]MBM3099062.1 CinA family protein [Gluconobacter cerinus]
MSETDFRSLCEQVLAHLAASNLRLVTVESCTGGMICASLTDIAGSSSVIEGGFVTYSNALKSSAAGVPEDTLVRYGAVSEETARAMADGALWHAADATVAVSVTGIAGPDGGSAEKPVGTVCFGLAVFPGKAISERHVFSGDRTAVRKATVRHALEMILKA